MSGAKKPPEDPELDAAVLRVPYWRALGLTAAALIVALPVMVYVARDPDRAGVADDDAWLEGSSWRIVEIERRTLAREGAMHFRKGRLVVEADGCAAREAGYRLTSDGIALTLPNPNTPAPCAHPAMAQTWERLPTVRGLTRYATGMALTDAAGRDLIRLRR